jgi:glycosyltransferase involved in cell wall biosynthesis
MLPYVSVCIPVRNGAGQLSHTLSNLLRHTTYPADRFEIVVGDHGSTDATARVLAEWAGQYRQLRVIQVPYSGPNRATVRNRLIAESAGELVVFIDHDVLTSPGFIAGHAGVHAAHPSALVAGMTHGKGLFKQPIDGFLDQLDLDDIGRSLSVLEANPELADARTSPGWLPPDPIVDVRAQLAPFRYFWGCNISARRADIETCGGFDEGYEGWGIEDDDFAARFYTAGKSLLFARAAWAFHIPHSVDVWRSIMSWRKNLARLFRKLPTREMEFYTMYVGDIASGARRMGWFLSLLAHADLEGSVDAVRHVVPPRGARTRLTHFVRPESAVALDATDALSPFGPLQAQPERKGGIQFWPFIGLCTPLEDRSIDEALILVDVVMLLDRTALTLLLSEAARTCRKLILCYGPRTADPAYRIAVETLESVAGNLRVDIESVSAGAAFARELA